MPTKQSAGGQSAGRGGPARKKAPRKATGGGSRRKAAPPRSRGRRLLRWSFYLLLFLALAGAGILAGGYWYFARGLPDFEKVTDYRPPQVSRVLAADGSVIAEIFEERRTVVPREQIAEVLVQAVLAAEDADFYQHEGLDYPGMLRALYNSARAGRVTGSGSTITQQTVKNLLLTHERTFERKAREIILTRRLETRLSKDDILTIYLNNIYLGHGRYGVQEAARYYWDKDARDLTLPEAATLAGIIQSPERLSPRKHPERARERRAYVLGQMRDKKLITPEAAAAADKADFGLSERPDEPAVAEAGWFADEVRKQVTAALGDEVVRTGGLRIYTTLDPKRQAAAVDALRAGLHGIDGRQKYGRPRARVPDAEAEAWRAKRRKALKDQPPRPGKAVPARVTQVEQGALVLELGVGTARVRAANTRRFAGEGGAPPYAPGDVVDVVVRADGPQHPEQMNAVLANAPQAALVVLDPHSRHVLALVGGYDYRDYPFDRAQARRQPGSAFKPFVWGAAFEARSYTAATLMVDAPEVWHLRKGKWWKPKNYTGKFRGPVSLRKALAHSVNSIAVKLAHELGVDKVHDFARRAGIESPLADNLTVALGSSEVSPLELVNAYATFAVDGVRAKPRFIVRVAGPDGPIPTPMTAAEEDRPVDRTFEPDLVWVLRDVMRSVVTEGSGTGLKGFARPVVGKTGTSNAARDTWFVGLLPDVVVGAWVGFDVPRELGKKETGGTTALPLVKAYLEAAETQGPSWAPPPEGVVGRAIVAETGRLAPEGVTGTIEHFLVGTEPTETALPDGQVDARSFFMEELAGPPVAVPRVDLAPLPEDLRPAAPRRADPLDLAPIAPARAVPAQAEPEDADYEIDEPPPGDAPEEPEELDPDDPDDDLPYVPGDEEDLPE